MEYDNTAIKILTEELEYRQKTLNRIRRNIRKLRNELSNENRDMWIRALTSDITSEENYKNKLLKETGDIRKALKLLKTCTNADDVEGDKDETK